MVVVYASQETVGMLRTKDPDEEIRVVFRFVPLEDHTAIGLPLSRVTEWDGRHDEDPWNEPEFSWLFALVRVR